MQRINFEKGDFPPSAAKITGEARQWIEAGFEYAIALQKTEMNLPHTRVKLKSTS